MKRWITLACAIAVATAMVVPVAQADTWNKKTIITTNGQLEIPGNVVLEPGKYVLKLADSMSSRHIVQVFNEDENKIYATILAIPNYRLQPTDKTVITTWETPAGQPPAIRSWFYPGDNFGQEFAYPKRRATELSQVNTDLVPTMVETAEAPAVEEETVNRAAVDTPDHAEFENPYVDPDAVAETPEPARSSIDEESDPTLMAQNRPQEPPADPAQQTPAPAAVDEPGVAGEPDELPQTASPAALIGLLGLGSLGVAAAFRAVTRRRR